MTEIASPPTSPASLRPRVAHLTSVHPATDIRIFQKECRTLAEAGYDVVLIVPHDRSEVRDGVRIRAVPRPAGRLARMRTTVRQVLAAAIEEDADVYHFHDPELIPVGLALKARGKRVVYDVHENVPEDMLTKDYLPRWALQAVSRSAAAFEALGGRCFDGVVAVTKTIGARFPADKTVLVQNFPLGSELAATDAPPYAERPPLVLYAGLITPLRGTLEMVDAMDLLPADHDARLVLLGQFSDAAHEAATRARSGWARVEYPGWVSRAEMAAWMGRTRVGLVLFHPAPNHADAQPNKLFEYMSAGIPIVASHFPLWRELIEGTGCGLVVDPLDPHAIAEAIRYLFEHPVEAATMGARGQAAVASRFNWDNEARALLGLYDRLAPR